MVGYMSSRRTILVFVTFVIFFALVISPLQTMLAANDNVLPRGDSTRIGQVENPDSPAFPAEEFLVYLPLLVELKNQHAYGQITEKNVPVANTTIQLRYYDGVVWSTWATTQTDANGDYFFFYTPELSGNQRYYVNWSNTDNGSIETRIWRWICNYVRPDSPPGTSLCNFDLENIAQVSPDHRASVRLPYTFTWQPRQTISDSYGFNMWDPLDDDPTSIGSHLGYVNGYTLLSRPAGFLTSTEYGWDVNVYGPHGYGWSFYYYIVTFRNGSPGGATMMMSPQDRDEIRDPLDEIEARMVK